MGRTATLLAAVVGLLASTSPAGAIVGGEEADAGEWPWQVSIVEDGEVVCGGAVLTMEAVVTAAHCVDGIGARRLAIRAGTVALTDPGQERAVADVVVHGEYDGSESGSDIALLRLEQPFDAADGQVAPVALPDTATAAALATAGRPAVVTGFGATSEDGNMSDRLLEAEIEVLDDAVCTRRYAEDGDAVHGASQVCAGLDRGHVDACYGDSGGPLVAPADDERSGWYLLGLVSWGAGCGRPFRPTVYTEIAAFTDWLAEQGALGVAGARFSSAQPLRLPAFGTRGKASRYPSAVRVRGVDGPVGGVAVELHGLRHARPADLDVWLQAPDGTVVTLFSDVGGVQPVSGVDLVIASGSPAAGDRPLPLRFAPTDDEADLQRKGARPAANLDTLAGVEGNGEWQLLVADDQRGASGRLEGWTLVLLP